MSALKDFRTKQPSEWASLLIERRATLRDLRFKAATRQLRQVHLIARAKCEIAQLETLVRTLVASS